MKRLFLILSVLLAFGLSGCFSAGALFPPPPGSTGDDDWVAAREDWIQGAETFHANMEGLQDAHKITISDWAKISGALHMLLEYRIGEMPVRAVEMWNMADGLVYAWEPLPGDPMQGWFNLEKLAAKAPDVKAKLDTYILGDNEDFLFGAKGGAVFVLATESTLQIVKTLFPSVWGELLTALPGLLPLL
jgi:hypothetical protein